MLEQATLTVGKSKLGLRDWYRLYYGAYPSIVVAEVALKQLPLRLRQNGPFVKQVDKL